jgi:Putative MetA-pathway of phenol degradation
MNWNALKLVLITAAACLTAVTPSRAQEAEAAAVEVTGAEPGILRQDAPVGPYNQPEWTTQRPFGASRVYVRPPGTLSFNQFWTPEFKDGEIEHSFRHEVEIGLPYRFELDLYQNWNIEHGDTFYKGSSVELRYALANWGKIPLNPTLYGEWNFNHDAPDRGELKLLLGQTFGRRWNWAGNFTYEQETGGKRERETALSSALTYALIDQTLNAGVEMLWERKTSKDTRGDPENEFLIGPSINVRPTRFSFITVAPLFGMTEDSPEAEVFVIAGLTFRFGGPPGPDEEGPTAPASMFGR